MGECRNCGASVTKDLGFIGEVAPFFLKRVLQVEYGFSPSDRPLKRFLRSIGSFNKILEKIYGKCLLLEMEICTSCSFIQTKVPFREEALSRLYTDYRSDSYNRERIRYEPEYASLASHVGNCAQEVHSRRAGLTEWLRGKLNIESNFSMLDYGGADGKFLPDLPGDKYVFDISDVAPAEGIVRINAESDLGSYSYIQIAHVLEHVSHPLALTRKAGSFLKDSGYLYVEVPQELSNEARIGLMNGLQNISLPIHEHINGYSLQSVTELMRSTGLSLVAIQAEEVNFGWTKGTIIRALGRK